MNISQIQHLDLLLKVTLLHGLFSRFLNCTNGTKSRKASPVRIRVRDVFRTISKSLLIFSHKSSIINVGDGPKYASESHSQETTSTTGYEVFAKENYA